MDETEPRMTTLFQQLGLDAGEQAIADFIGISPTPAMAAPYASEPRVPAGN